MIQTQAQKSQAELLFEAQQRRDRLFKTNVAISWVVLLGLLIFMFSGPIDLDTEFIRKNVRFIATGTWQTLFISILSILLAILLALLAALGRLSTLPPIYALSTFYVSLIRGTPLFLKYSSLSRPATTWHCPTRHLVWHLPLGLNYGAYERNVPCEMPSEQGREAARRSA
jgi:polar amino acid transport system permease protein